MPLVIVGWQREMSERPMPTTEPKGAPERSQRAITLLARTRVFRALPSEVLFRQERRAPLSELRIGVELFLQGHPTDAVYAVVGGEGSVRIGLIDQHCTAEAAKAYERAYEYTGGSFPAIKAAILGRIAGDFGKATRRASEYRVTKRLLAQTELRLTTLMGIFGMPRC
jgi:hypothetical protein